MPRPNPPREVYAEDHLAGRVAQERVARDMSYEGLAERMKNVGCPIDQSALYKIEKATPRRRITVDELVAFARVFDLSLEDLTTDPRLTMARTVAPLLEEWRRLTAQGIEVRRTAADLDARADQVARDVRALVAESPDVTDTVRAWFRETMAEGSTWTERLADIVLDEDDADATVAPARKTRRAKR